MLFSLNVLGDPRDVMSACNNGETTPAELHTVFTLTFLLTQNSRISTVRAHYPPGDELHRNKAIPLVHIMHIFSQWNYYCNKVAQRAAQ